MSNRDSMGFGDLLPQDVVEIFAQEKQGKRGRKKRSHSLGRALGWLKGKKRKDLGANGQSLGLGPALDLALDVRPAGHQGGHKGGHKSGRQAQQQGNSHAVPNRDNDDKTPAPPLVQENVFIEASRPKYLEDLHTEAQEGLKMMQQEETDNGVEYQDNESTISTMTVQTDGNGEGFMTDSTIPDTSSVVSGQSSTRSSRSGLTRQGSTFRPLNSGKNPEKAKTRRRHRKTVVGIPQHVQRELGLDRVGWKLSSKVEEEQPFNGETDGSPTTDGPELAAESQKGASGSLQDMNIIEPLRKHHVEQHCATHAGHRDDLALLHRLGPDCSDGQRPRSLAVPWMTTANSLQQQPPSPVMSMSPQAPYMSKIIPNAVMPPSIEVVEISRGRSRNSLRTVSKSSLLLSSPAPSRASSRGSSRTISSRASNITSASRYNPPHLSDSSCWSNSQSSETLVSDDSTISSSSTTRQKRSQDVDASAKEDKVSVHSSISKASKCTSNGNVISKGDKTKDEGPIMRSLSVMKPKRAPPPPNRSYSLHNKMKRRSRDLAEARINTGESPRHNISVSGEANKKNNPESSPVSLRNIDSPDYNADTSSLDDSTGSVSISPFKSQLQSLKTEEASKVGESEDPSIEKQELLQENKPSKMISPSSGYSSQDATSPQLSKPPHISSPRHKRGILAKLQRLFPASTHSGPTPSPLTQPEAPENTKSTDESSVDTVSVSPSVRALRELFNIPPPPKIHAPPPPPPEVWAHNKRTFELLLGPPAPDNTYAIIKKNPKDRRQQRQSPSSSAEGSMKSLAGEKIYKNPTITAEAINGSQRVLETKEAQESGLLNAEIQKENNERLVKQNDLKGSGKVTEKDEKVRVSEMLSGIVLKAVEKREERLAALKEEETKKTSAQVKTVDTLPAISLVRISPSPSPPPVDRPSLPSGQVVVSPEMSWPPPPPAMDQVGFSGVDDIDFPIPPPPLFCEERLVIPVQVPTETSIPDAANIEQISSSTAVVKKEYAKVTTDPETLKSSSSQGLAPPPLSIPPPPPYTAPPPPVKAVSPPSPPMTNEVILPPPKDFSPPPPTEDPTAPKEVFSLPPKKASPLPPKKASPLPPKKASPLPPKKASPLPPKKASPPPPKEVSPPLPTEVSPPPPTEVIPPPPTEVSPPPPTEVSPPPPTEVIPPPPTEVSPPPPTEVSPPPPTEVSPPPPNKVSPLPSIEVSPLPPEEVSLPPPIEVSPLPPEEVSCPPPIEVSSLPPEEVSPPPAVEVSPLPPDEASPLPPEEVSCPPPVEVSPLQPEELSPPPHVEGSPLPPEELSPPPPVDVSPLPPEEVSSTPSKENSPVMPEESSPPQDQPSSTSINVISPPPDIEVSAPPAEEVTPPSCQENAPQSSEEPAPDNKLCSSQSISPLPTEPEPPLQSQLLSTEEEIDVPLESIPSESNPITCTSILTPPQSIPPPPPIEVPPPSEVAPLNTDGLATQDAPPSLPHEASIPPAQESSPSQPVQDLDSIKDQPSPVSTENQSPEPSSVPVVEEQSSLIITPSLLHMVKLRSANNSPEPPKAQEQAQAEVIMRHKQPSNQVPSSSANGEAPQKPIRKSLIMTSPPIITSEPALPTSQSVAVSPTSSTTVLSPTKKSAPAMTISPSMNLQEAIRLRTAARSKEGPISRLSLQSPTSPIDPRKSPSSTASFIFSKSNKTVVIESKPTVEAVETSQKNLEITSVTKGAKMPPPVAKKPKTKAKETETSEGTEQTAGQEAQPESIRDTLEKTIRTAAGTVEGGDR